MFVWTIREQLDDWVTVFFYLDRVNFYWVNGVDWYWNWLLDYDLMATLYRNSVLAA